MDSHAFADTYDALVEAYSKDQVPIEVNFRRLVPIAAGADRSTHLIHSYPAKLLVGIPAFFVNCEQLSMPGSVVLDPFCGTGTVLLEALLAGRVAGGADSNPLARLIAKVKLTPLDARRVRAVWTSLSKPRKKYLPVPFAPVVDVQRWYAPRTAQALGRLLAQIEHIRDDDLRDFFTVCFSACVKRLSFSDPRLSVPVRLKNVKVADGPSEMSVRATFNKVVEANRVRISRLIIPNTGKFIGVSDDARTLTAGVTGHPKRMADLVVTSPPYLSAQKYIRSSSLSLGWLGLAPGNRLRTLESNCIGREHLSVGDRELVPTTLSTEGRGAIAAVRAKNPERAAIASAYFAEMSEALLNTIANLRVGGHLVLVMANNTVCGETFRTSDYVAEMARSMGLSQELELVDHIRSRGLMTKRNATAGLISREHIHVFRKKGAA
jgi:hypothetical protein